eukprot:1974502-Amphidinium_carterae.1
MIGAIARAAACVAGACFCPFDVLMRTPRTPEGPELLERRLAAMMAMMDTKPSQPSGLPPLTDVNASSNAVSACFRTARGFPPVYSYVSGMPMKPFLPGQVSTQHALRMKRCMKKRRVRTTCAWKRILKASLKAKR